MATMTLMPGLTAAIVWTAIDKITQMMGDAETSLAEAVSREINAAQHAIPVRPDVMGVSYAEQYGSVGGALKEANIEKKDPPIDTLPLFLDNVVGSFFEDYVGKMDALFPGLGAAGDDADAFVRNALNSAIGMSYDEVVDSTPAKSAFALASRQAFAQERQALDAAAKAGHRFAHGVVLESLARMHGASIESATQALAQAHEQRLMQERSEKMRLVQAQLATSMDRIKRLHQQVAEAFKLKLQARGMWVNDQNAVVDAANNIYATNEKFQTHITELLRKVASRRFALDFDEKAIKDRGEFMGKILIANANEVVDLFGNAITTLMNQVHASGRYGGTERDVTDWDSILA
ncbi:MAG: hypothetical protein WC322_00200 [Candidatus Paceibacterota bacterium]|jgi:predicted RNA-binding protein YlxR (DUF448 family)/uncharacterized protein YfiM (DUF2279 family)